MARIYRHCLAAVMIAAVLAAVLIAAATLSIAVRISPQTSILLNNLGLSDGSVDGENLGLSSIESEHFLVEPDALWSMRQERHKFQMQIQNETMTTCPHNVEGGQRPCYPGCTSEPKYSGTDFSKCRSAFNATNTLQHSSTSGAQAFCSAPKVKGDCHAPVFWQVHYEPSFRCAFERRIGGAGEGGKWVCDPSKISDKISRGEGCLVYSVGSNGQYGFEEAVHKTISPACEIHTIDKNNWKVYGRPPPEEYIHYHEYALGVLPNATPMSTIVHELGHDRKTIDIFKIDCEGCEWSTFRKWFGHGVYIRQILVELHGTGDAGENAHDFFNFLFDQGYVVFSKEPNIFSGGGVCVEYGFLKMSPEFSRRE